MEANKIDTISIPESTCIKIPGLVLNPLGVVTYIRVMNTGEFLQKMRVTHDISFPRKFSKILITSRVQTSSLEPYMFAHVPL